MYQISDDLFRGSRDVSAGCVTVEVATHMRRVLAQSRCRDIAVGDVLPPLWHWFALWRPIASEMPSDHRGRGHHSVTPSWTNPQPFWGKGYVEFIQPIHVGETLEKRTSIATVLTKKTQFGTMKVIGLDHQVCGQAGLAVLERQDIYIFESASDATVPKFNAPAARPDIEERFDLAQMQSDQPPHFDIDPHQHCFGLTCTTEQSSQCLGSVSQVPLQATLLMDLIVRHTSRAPMFFSFTGLQEFAEADVLCLQARKESDTEWALCSSTPELHPCMRANAIWPG